MKKFLLALTLLAPTLFGASLPVAADSDGSLKTLTNGVTVKVKSANLDSSLDLSGKTINNANIVGATITGSSVAGTGNFETLKVTAAPTLPTDVVNKLYADTAATGLSPQTACALATTGNLTLSGEQTIDGVLTSGSRVLVKNQSAPAQNGIYVTAAGAWTRATDADTTGEVLVNQYYLVTGGSTNAGTGWFIQTAPATLGTNPLTFGQFSSLSGTFLKTNNLSDIPSASSARTNLGLGSIATQNASNVSITGGFLDGTTIGSITPYPATFNSLGVTGTITLNGAGRFILGDYSTLTQADRPFFKTSVSNGNTYLGARPDGTGNSSGFNLFGTSDVTTNSYRLSFTADSSQAGIINSLATGTATIRPLRLQVQSSTVGEFNTSGLAVTGTLSATGQITGTAQAVSNFNHASGTYSRWQVGGANRGIIGSANNVFGGSTDDFAVCTENAGRVLIGANNSAILEVSTTGLAVTGTLSATGTISLGNASTISWGGAYGAGTPAIIGSTGAGELQFRPTGSTGGTIATVSATGLAVTGQTSTTSLFYNTGGSTVGNGFRLVQNSGDNLISLIRNDTLAESGSALLSAYGSILFVTGATTTGTSGTLVGSFSNTGLAVTGALSATGNIQVGVNLGFNGGTNEAIAYSAGAIKTYIGGLPITAVSSTGLAVTGTTTSTNATIINSTGANDAFVSLNNTGGGFGGYTWNLRTYAANGKMSMYGLNDWLTVDYNTGATVFTTLSASSNANLRTTKTNLNLTVNVKDFGATGNGTTDDSTAILAAVAALTNGSTLYFPAGTYKTSQVIIASLTGVSIIGEGWTNTIVKSNANFDAGDGFGVTQGGSILDLRSTSSKITVRGITWDANCTHRKAGQQAVKVDSSYVNFTECRIINSGEFAFSTGRSSAITDLIVTNNRINSSYSDGLNIYNVTRGVVSNNIVDGTDDDLLMIGKCTNVVANGNYLNARTDLGTSVGRGIAVLGENTNILVSNNNVHTVKQYGIYVASEGSTRSTQVRLIGNTVNDAAVNSGSSVYINTTDYVDFIDNVIYSTRAGDLVTIADWNTLTIMGGSLTSNYAGYSRGIHAESSAGWSATWTGLTIKDVQINILNSSSNESIYLDPHSSVSMSKVMINGVSSRQAVTGNYIFTNRLSTNAKIVNCTSLEGRSIANGGTGLAPTTANNN